MRSRHRINFHTSPVFVVNESRKRYCRAALGGEANRKSNRTSGSGRGVVKK